MNYIKLDETIQMSQVVAGCMRATDAGMGKKDLLKFVGACIDMGVTTFDHAPVYGGYGCEKFFGDAVLKSNPGLREKMQLVTKTGIVLPGRNGNKTIYYDSSKTQILKEMDESLSKLATDHVDLLLVHRPDPLANPRETAEALEILVREGKALHVGVSNFLPSQIAMLQSYMKTPLVTNQVELSVKTVETFFNGVADDAFARKMPLMAWSPLGGGSVFAGLDEQSLRLKGVLREIAQVHHTSVDTIMYAWLFVHPVQIAAITGSMKIDRIKKATEALEIQLSYDEWYQILAASRGYDVP